VSQEGHSSIKGRKRVHWPEVFPLLREHVGYEDEQEELRHRLISEQEAFLEANKKSLPKGLVYLNSRLHDNWVRNVRYDGHNLAITLNEFSTHCFCDALVDTHHLDVPHEMRILPITVQFRRVSACSLYSIWEEKILQTKPYLARLSEWLYDEIIRIDSNLISAGVVFWARTLTRKRRRLLLQVECEALRFLESQEKEFLRLFGVEFLEQFASFWKKREAGRCFDYSSALKFIKHGAEGGSQRKVT
jgi:hypothetical protein